MKIHILADLHIEFGDFTPPDTDADVVVLAGDVHRNTDGLAWALDAFGEKPVVYVLGNHEYYGEAMPKLADTIKERAKGSNVHVLENDAVEIDGVMFLGCTLWSDFRLFGVPKPAGAEAAAVMNDFKKIRVAPEYRLFTPVDAAAMHGRSLRWLTSEIELHRGERVVVVTHHAPTKRSVPEQHADSLVTAAYASHLDDFVRGSDAGLWVHGHIHTRQDYPIGPTRVICNPRGYVSQEQTAFDPGLVIEV